MISNFKNVKTNENNINLLISISLKNSTNKNSIDCSNIIKNIVAENQKNFHNINSYLCIGLLKIKNIVFHSTSLNNSCEPTNNTHTSQNISIIDNQKSTITLESSQIVSFHSSIEKTIKTKAKKSIKYKNLFLTISLKVLVAMFNMLY
ncbi:hypothetical protein HOG21_01730 [bacterium]|jgi:hypothetical protein|nr:hypothetical protein [bacterium]